MTANEIIPQVEILDGPQSLTTYQADIEILPMAQLWQNFLRASGKHSDKTAKSYQTSAGAFLVFLGLTLETEIAQQVDVIEYNEKKNRNYTRREWAIYGDTTPLLEVKSATLDNFALWLKNNGNSQTTISLRVSGVNTFLGVALRDNVIPFDQAQRMGIKPYKSKQKRTQAQVGRRLSQKEVRALRATVELCGRNETKVIRDRAILDCMLYAGLRREEVATLDRSNFLQDGGRWWMVVTGKGDKIRRLKIHDMLYKSLVSWLLVIGAEFGAGDTGPVFYNLTKSGKLTGNQLNANVIGRLVAEYGAAAGLAPASGDNRLSPHDLRRTCARNAYDNGATIYQVQTMLGHASADTTQRYIGALEDDSNTAIDKVSY